jgi:hypothetical protein
MDSKNLYVLPVVENGEALCYYCLIRPIESTHCIWFLLRNGARAIELLSHGVCGHVDVDLMLDSFRTDLSLNCEPQEWTKTAIH